MILLRFALRMLLRDLRAGELNAIAAALTIAMTAVTAVNLFAERVERGLQVQAAQLLAADLAVISDHPVPDAMSDLAGRQHLLLARTTVFNSMARHQRGVQLVTVKAVSDRYPLVGRLDVRTVKGYASKGPPSGVVWVDPSFLQRTGIKLGESVWLGDLRLQVAGEVVSEPDASFDVFSFVPRIMISDRDLPATGLLTTGSRARYRLQLAGPEARIAAWRHAVEPVLGRGEKLESAADARPEVRNAIARAKRFLAVSSMVTVVLALVAIGMATRRYVERHLDPAAVMRCLGASQTWLFANFVSQFACLGVLAGGVGVGAGWLLQSGLASLLGGAIKAPIPEPSLWVAGQAWLIGIVLLMIFALPPVWQLRGVPTLRVLRRERLATGLAARWIQGLGLLAVAGLLFWWVGDARLAGFSLLGFAATAAAGVFVAWLSMRMLGRLSSHGGMGWRYGLAHLSRHRTLTLLQIMALSLGLMAALVLTLVRSDLIQSWQRSVPSDAPNRFMINIQTHQLSGIRQLFVQAGLPVPLFYPTGRARLQAINGRPVSAASYQDERARNLVEREFNLSWGTTLPPENRIVAGRWWFDRQSQSRGFSVEEGLARTLGIRLGDTLHFDLAGSPMEAAVSSLREVDWDNFRVNFFVIAAPGMEQPTGSYLCSFYLPPGAEGLVSKLVNRYPELTVIDVSLILRQVQTIVDRVVQAVQIVFALSLLAGIVVLQAALTTTQDERMHEAAVLRTLGASRRQVLKMMLAEYVLIGCLAGMIASIGAMGLGWAVSHQLLSLPWLPSPWLPLAGMLGGCFLVIAAGWWRLKAILAVPPLHSLNRMG